MKPLYQSPHRRTNAVVGGPNGPLVRHPPSPSQYRLARHQGRATARAVAAAGIGPAAAGTARATAVAASAVKRPARATVIAPEAARGVAQRICGSAHTVANGRPTHGRQRPTHSKSPLASTQPHNSAGWSNSLHRCLSPCCGIRAGLKTPPINARHRANSSRKAAWRNAADTRWTTTLGGTL